MIGGDGTILRGAALARLAETPLLGINLGHVGFLAEAEWDDLESTVDAIIGCAYVVEERMTVDVTVTMDGAVTSTGWALNEVSVEKAARQRMLEVVVEIDDRPLSRWGCDGVVFATPTGSTAYAFSAGGPVVWPEVEALLLVPISAHALFARPMVTSPDSDAGRGARRTHDDTGAVMWCDGRTGCRSAARCPGRGTPRRASRSGSPDCTKHRSPTGSWRSSTYPSRAGAAPQPNAPAHGQGTLPMLEELRISGLGVIDEAPPCARTRLHRCHRGDWRRKDDGRDGLGCCWAGARIPARSARVPARPRSRGGSRSMRTARSPPERSRLGPSSTKTSLILARTVSSEGRSRAVAGGSGVPAGLLSELAGDLVVIHGQSDQQQLLHPSRQRECLDLFGGSKLLAARAAFRSTYERVRDLTAELEQVTSHRRERAQEADLLRFGLGEIDAVEPIAGEDAELLAEESRLAHADGLARSGRLGAPIAQR